MDISGGLIDLSRYPFWVGVILCYSLFYLSLSSEPIYRNLERVGGGILDWMLWIPVDENIKNGYRQYAKRLGRPFVVKWWAKDYLVMPQRYLTEVRGADAKALSFFHNIQDVCHAHHCLHQIESADEGCQALWLKPSAGDLYTAKSGDRMVEVVTKGINLRLPQITPYLIEEVNVAFDAALGSFSSQNEVYAFDFFGSIAKRVAVRLLIGRELCRDERFLQALDRFTASIFGTALIITKSPLGPLRPFLARFLSIRHVQRLRLCCRHLVPIIENRMQQDLDLCQGGDEVFNGLNFILKSIDSPLLGSQRDSVENLAIEVMHNLWAASSAPGGMIAEIVYQLLSDSEYVAPLRDEAAGAVRQFGWSEKMLNNLEKQDSFIREVNRLYPTGAMGVARTVMGDDYECLDGLKLPIKTRIAFPIQAIQSDPDNFRNAGSFDGFRFLSDGDGTSRDSATTMGISNLSWGYGNHMCPGRFLSVRLCKIVLTKLLVEYEIGWHRVERGKPPRWHVEGQFVPNMSQTILLTKRDQ